MEGTSCAVSSLPAQSSCTGSWPRTTAARIVRRWIGETRGGEHAVVLGTYLLLYLWGGVDASPFFLFWFCFGVFVFFVFLFFCFFLFITHAGKGTGPAVQKLQGTRRDDDVCVVCVVPPRPPRCTVTLPPPRIAYPFKVLPSRRTHVTLSQP